MGESIQYFCVKAKDELLIQTISKSSDGSKLYYQQMIGLHFRRPSDKIWKEVTKGKDIKVIPIQISEL